MISTYKKKHNYKRIHIIFDHMFSHDNYTVFMISMRIGKQGIPIWFRCFMKHIDSLGHTYILRMKQNIKVFYFDRTVKITATTLVALNSFLKYFESMYCFSLSYITRI